MIQQLPRLGAAVCCLFLALHLSLAAQERSDAPLPTYTLGESNVPAELRKMVDDFFAELAQNKPAGAFDKLLTGSRILDDSSSVATLVRQSQRALSFYGPQERVEFISAEAVTPSFIRVRYLALHRVYPIKWVFTFYRSPAEGWIVALLRLDDKVESSFTDGW